MIRCVQWMMPTMSFRTLTRTMLRHFIEELSLLTQSADMRMLTATTLDLLSCRHPMLRSRKSLRNSKRRSKSTETSMVCLRMVLRSRKFHPNLLLKSQFQVERKRRRTRKRRTSQVLMLTTQLLPPKMMLMKIPTMFQRKSRLKSSHLVQVERPRPLMLRLLRKPRKLLQSPLLLRFWLVCLRLLLVSKRISMRSRKTVQALSSTSRISLPPLLSQSLRRVRFRLRF
mmetsp:Transcript_24831/g.33906  ORF Transcript_24831/g.33906 Transcript_24831/m.33906 type:complete len:227 (+) Transcript_24831:2448-3128(+)